MGRNPRTGPALAVEDDGDVPSRHIGPPGPEVLREPEIKPRRGAEHALVDPAIEIGTAGVIGGAAGAQRSEERRVGKECRALGAPCDLKETRMEADDAEVTVVMKRGAPS